jgi:hypothetical protein
MISASGSASGGPPKGGGGGFDGAYCAIWTPGWCGVIDVICDAYQEHGPDNSEKSYVDKVFYKLYDLGVPCIRERTLYSTESGVSIRRGRVDLEVGKKFLYEFKVVAPTPSNLRKDSRQLMRYLKTYKENGIPVLRAALVYLYGGEVRIVEVSIEEEKKYRFSPYDRDPQMW